jgi:hypothetical protein
MGTLSLHVSHHSNISFVVILENVSTCKSNNCGNVFFNFGDTRDNNDENVGETTK